eukprot:2321336-Prymnesium_polylepis.1
MAFMCRGPLLPERARPVEQVMRHARAASRARKRRVCGGWRERRPWRRHAGSGVPTRSLSRPERLGHAKYMRATNEA